MEWRLATPIRGAVFGRGRAVAAAMALALAVLVAPAAAQAETGTTTDRYSVVHGCFALTPASGGGFVKQVGDGYDTSAASIGDAEPFRLQATDLGKYLFFGQAQDFMGIADAPSEDVVAATAPSARSDWTVKGADGSFTIVNGAADRALAVDGAGVLVTVPAADAETFRFRDAGGCATYPEIGINTTGEPGTGSPRYGEVKGTVDGHMHMMAFEFLGRQAHCGQPWHKFGVVYALKDCVDHEPNGCGAALETGLGGDPCHETTGWPSFEGWPKPESLTHESSYYKWLERAHAGGLRVFVNLYVENRALCKIYPPIPASDKTKSNCNEMDSVLREWERLHELEDYIDAQEGGPRKGWFRIVESPFQARKAINKGKLAVVQGMEVSEPFNCGLRGGPVSADEDAPAVLPPETPDPRCTEEGIDQWLDDLHGMGIRQLEITNKFDNALTGVAGDGGSTGVIVNGGQFLTSGTFWNYEECQDEDNHDRVPATQGPTSQDEIFGNLLEEYGGPAGLPTVLPVFGPGEECNEKGLTDTGAYAIDEIMERGMIFDPDHMSVKGRNAALDQVVAADYPGVVSSHSWSTENALPRIYSLGGLVTPYAGNSTSFVSAYEELKAPALREELGDQYFGVGYGADANGFGSQGSARNPQPGNEVTYPFESFDGSVTVDQQVSGTKTYDINTDGVAHYGLYPDWIEDLRMLAGDGIVRDMNRGAEAYLQMWERTAGIGEVDCSQWGDESFNPKGLGDELRLNRRPKRALRSAGQPVDREKTWRWCAADGGRGSAQNVLAAFSNNRNKMDFAISNLREHEIDGVGPGDRKKKLKKAGQKISKKVWISRKGGRRAYVWVTKGRRVSHAGAVSQSAARDLDALSARLAKTAAAG